VIGSISGGLSERYTRFADNEAQRRSPLYETLARGVAHDAEVIEFLSASRPRNSNRICCSLPSAPLTAFPKTSGTSGAACSAKPKRFAL
jgi:hypothetical protein